jgi:predicted Zn-dependent protease
MKMTPARILILAGVVLFLLLSAGGVLWYVRRHRKVSITPEAAYKTGQTHLAARRFRDAYGYLNEAARQRPADANYQWAAAQAAIALRGRSTALPHARAAWDNGLKTPDVLLAMADCTKFDNPGQRLKSALEWLKELPDDRARRELEGDLHYSAATYDESLRIWKALFAAAPSAPLARKIAMADVGLNKPDEALAFLESCRGGPNLDEEGYVLLGRMLVLKGKFKEADAVYAEGRARYPDGESLRLNEAIFRMIQDRLSDAAALLDPLKARASDYKSESVRQHARLYLGLLHAARSDAPALDALAALAEGDAPSLEGERLFYGALKSGLSEKQEKKAALEDIKKARVLVRGHPAVELAYARELGRNGEWADAAAAYRGIPGLFEMLPSVQFDLAQALYRAGKLDEALATLGRLHASGVYSKPSLELYRDVAFRKNLTREGLEAQKLLEQRFAGDPDVLLRGGLIALEAGKLDEAAAALKALAARHPGREDVEIARLTVLLKQSKYDDLLRECASSRAPRAALAAFQAEALVKLGRRAEAEAVYEKCLAEKPDPQLMLSYGHLLLGTGQQEKAGAWYANALKASPGNPAAHLGLALVAMQRKDWAEARRHAEPAAGAKPPIPYAHLVMAEIELMEGRPAQALAASDRAVALAPDDPRARFLRGMSCLELGRLDEAESILQRCAADHPGVPHVRYQLVRAKMARGADVEALRLVDDYLARHPDDLDFLRSRFALLGRLKRWDAAQAALDRIAPKLPPQTVLLSKAWLLQQEGRHADAATILRDKLDDPALAYAWAESMLKLGRAEGVLEALDRRPLTVRQWSALADVALSKDLHAVSAACYRRAVRLDPENPTLLNNFAWEASRQEPFDAGEVIAAARKACALRPDDVNLLDTYATVLLRCKKEADCIALLEKSPAVTGRSAKLLYHLAQARERTGALPRALRWYTAALNHPDTASGTGDLSKPALQKKIDQLRALLEPPGKPAPGKGSN